MPAPRPHEGVSRIVPYVPGWAKLPNLARTFKLSSNESAVGPSPKAIAAARDALENAALYPSPGGKALRQSLAKHFDIDPEMIFCGGGSEDIIRLLACAYSTTGDDVVYTEHGFLAYPISAQVAGARTVVASEKNRVVDVDAILERLTPASKIVFLANPGNPTGTYIPESELTRLRDGLPSHVLLVIDSAYAEYVDEQDYSAGWELVDRGEENVVMTRTFSKAYGLAAMRVGWAYASESIVRVLDKVKDQFNVTGPAQAAAQAALEDRAHLEKALQYNRDNKLWLEERFRAMGIDLTASVANFVLAKFAGGADQCNSVNEFLIEGGITVKPGAISGLSDSLRITVGPRDALERLDEALKAHLT